MDNQNTIFKVYSLFFIAIILQEAISWKQPINSNMKSFSHSIKEGHCFPGKEFTLFAGREGPGVVTEQWFGGCFDEKTIITYYIDDDPSKTIEANLFMMVGNAYGILDLKNLKNDTKGYKYDTEGYNYDTEGYNYNTTGHNNHTKGDTNHTKGDNHSHPFGIPWGNRRIGQITEHGGIYWTIRIPFKKIRVTARFFQKNDFWYVIRGVDNYALTVGDLLLPSEARLKLYKLENIPLAPNEYISLATNFNSSGLIYLLSFAGTSKNYAYLEGCFRLLSDGDSSVQYLSSGTEDIFLSSYYFSSGLFHTENSGLVIKQAPGTISAFKFFEEDPLIFKDSFSLIWRCGEIYDNNCFAHGPKERCKVSYDGVARCGPTEPLDESMIRKIKAPFPSATRLATYVWTYEW